MYNLEQDFTFPFEMKMGKPCAHSGGVWDSLKMQTLQAALAGNVVVHVSTFGRYHHTQIQMAQNEYVKAANITTPQYCDEARRNEMESATSMAHESERVRLQNYLVSKDAVLQSTGKVKQEDVGKRLADGSPSSRLIGYAANNPDEFPWSDDFCMQAPSDSTSDLSQRCHRASECSIAEQSMMRYRLEKHKQHQQGLRKLEESGIDNPEAKRMIQWNEDMVEASKELWKRNFPDKWAARRTVKEYAWECIASLSPKSKRKRPREATSSSKRVKVEMYL
jgi:hypothetical protein